MRTVSPTGGPIRSATGCALATDAPRTTHVNATTARAFTWTPRRSEAVRIIRRSGAQREGRRSRRLARWNDAPKLTGKKRFHVIGPSVQRGIPSPDDFLLAGNRDRVLHPA